MSQPKTQSSIFLIEVEKIKPNPMQPRREFDEVALQSLSDSIRRYGVLQPLVVTRKETETDYGTNVEYELIAGERRWRASQLAGLQQVPVVIRGESDDNVKLELAIIENLQREDLNPIERARAFRQLVDSFRLRHHEVASRLGKSREYVTNTMRLLLLPSEIQEAVSRKEITEGHCRPILMLSERKEEQMQFYKDIVEQKMSVRAAERASRTIAVERARKKDVFSDPETKLIEQKLTDSLGTKVQVERDGDKRKIHIEFFSDNDLQTFLNKMISDKLSEEMSKVEQSVAKEIISEESPVEVLEEVENIINEAGVENLEKIVVENSIPEEAVDENQKEEIKKDILETLAEEILGEEPHNEAAQPVEEIQPEQATEDPTFS